MGWDSEMIRIVGHLVCRIFGMVGMFGIVRMVGMGWCVKTLN